MMKRNSVFILLLWLLDFYGVSQNQNTVLPIIPKPQSCEITQGQFTLSPTTKIVVTSSSHQNEIDWLNEYLDKYYHFKLKTTAAIPKNDSYLEFVSIEGESNEDYELTIAKNQIHISAKEKSAGSFYAIQTLIQLLPLEKTTTLVIPCLKINDSPRFKWRGMHLDVSRHFFSISFIKKYIDFLALYKMNTFHWHLTDDQGWRIEIKKYPKLTDIGAYRKGTMVGPYSDQKFDSKPYGGFYTQEEIKDIVAYASKRYITIVPEIEMPGHSVAAVAAYPWLSCIGKQIDVEKGWGVFEDVFCTKDSTFQFLENVLDEVMNLFPGKYIHIGGDECPKTIWKTCKTCQARIKTENLKNEHELQSYFITRIEKHVNSKGKQIIGWDEILEGGLAPNAAVMSWRGTEGGIEAAKQKHQVVMTPGSHCYFDHYQSAPNGEPLAIGGYTPLEKVYAFEPIPTELNTEEQNYILGAQANIWTEYILNEKHLEYMAMPRMAALAEVLWTPKDKKNETDFLNRLQTHFLLLDKLEINYAKALYKVEQKITPSSKPNTVELELIANASLGSIRYTSDGSMPNPKSEKYQSSINLDKDMTISSALFKDDQLKGKISSRNYEINKATNKPITLKNEPSKSYNYGGSFTLVNGVVAKLPRDNNEWLGWSGKDIEATINLEKVQEISYLQIGFLTEELNWIYLPKSVEFFVSLDGVYFTSIKKLLTEDFKFERFAKISFPVTTAKYVKIIAQNFGKIPSGKPGAGEDSWLFSDEIQIK